MQCSGPGHYEYGKGNPRAPCCEGLQQVFYKTAAWTGDFSEVPICAEVPGGWYACVRGECGDGVCEAGEAPACGCVQDCPQAAWEKPQSTDPSAKSGLRDTPASCKKADLLASLAQSPPGVDCGDLALDASADLKAKAAACARGAYVANEPFQVFWRTQGSDSIQHQGVFATRQQSGGLIMYGVTVDADSFGIDFQGATAAWSACQLEPGTDCAGSIDACLACTRVASYPVCGCLPPGARPGAPDGTMLEVRCELR